VPNVPNVPCPGPCLRKQRCANMMQDVDLNNDSNTNKEVNSTFFNFFEKGLCRIYAIPQGGSQSDLRSITRTSLALLKHGFTRCSVYIYYITYIYILYFYRVSGIVSGFHNWHKKWQFFESLSPFPSFPIPMAYPGIALFAERHQEVEIEEVQGKRRTSVPLATCRSDTATKRQ
jgi:hypothetical protein